jgi:hypothetical protein
MCTPISYPKALEPNLASDLVTSKLFARISLIVFGALLFLIPASARAANNCPWMNEATASGLVGGDAVGSFVESQGQPSVCSFTQHAGNVTRTLRISVEIAADPHARFLALAQSCEGSAVPLPAIGNEALVCPTDPHSDEFGEQVLGRVRDQVFTITISSSLKSDPVLNKADLKIKINTAAEQVSGNLF